MLVAVEVLEHKLCFSRIPLENEHCEVGMLFLRFTRLPSSVRDEYNQGKCDILSSTAFEYSLIRTSNEKNAN